MYVDEENSFVEESLNNEANFEEGIIIINSDV